MRSLAPSSDLTRSQDFFRSDSPVPLKDEDEGLLIVFRNRRCLVCCGCTTAFLLIQAVVILVLIFTLFRVRDPIININRIIITSLEGQAMNNNGSNIPITKPGVNMSLIADVSIKNPNFASFRYSNTTTALYYHEIVVGEALGPPGRTRPGRTSRMNITVDIIPDKLMSSPNLTSDLNWGVLPMSSYSRIPGRVKMLSIINKHVIVKMSCSIAVNISSQTIQDQKCKRKINLKMLKW
ncbi:hypothetical protein SAY86_004287 [Trapa natans]|uniref:Late embryogenesis abundant protein LEA-2 subgroup domain-containing protein n=1 Tax=Trapa natans TaxID=22666 RepID=A0AAN7RIQ6_TRANT|nr:hypothetical protein SAY86_004287 [Trapa natans]